MAGGGGWSYPGITVVLKASDCARVLLVLDESWRMTQGVHLREEEKSIGNASHRWGWVFRGVCISDCLDLGI